eukprot:gnl/TRDRNA2_/TRDRNA2_179683_c0_seq1.p1 gnl/TRDRNA2_/TRDRNA2_179683_c0~~gnl/TRDRNA2_/TRDRNA2_179683_c0_seq1.p1  ORF type:complete len:651 (+),score=130.92 gnl/TRDRNA2_/TRDRNA2_179683_c0_seq1:93-2045(+)
MMAIMLRRATGCSFLPLLLALHVNGTFMRRTTSISSVLQTTKDGAAQQPVVPPDVIPPLSIDIEVPHLPHLPHPKNFIKKLPMKERRHAKIRGHGYHISDPLFYKQLYRQDGNSQAAPGPAPASDGTPPVSITMQNVIYLISLFFLVSTAMFIVQTINQLTNKSLPRAEKCLVCAKETVMFAPMLCVLFIAARMRALQLTKNHPEEHDLPQIWVQVSMYVCTVALVGQTLLAAAYSAVFGESLEDMPKGDAMSMMQKIMNGVKYFFMFFIYAGFTTICIGICAMAGPEEVWGEEGPPPVPPALFAVMFLVVLYFSLYLCLAIATTINQAGCFGPPKRFGGIQEALKSAVTTVSCASMLCILFLAARMRANQLGVEPQIWAKVCFFVCVFSILVQSLLATVCSLMGAPPEGMTGKLVQAMWGGTAVKVIQIAWAILLLSMYAAIIGIFISVFSLKDQDGETRSVSPTVLNVILMCCIYFTIYLLTWIWTTVEQMKMTFMSGALDSGREETDQNSGVKFFLTVRARDAVDFCPMLCVLFVGMRLRALQLSDNKGNPQAWCQALMWVASCSILLQVLVRCDSIMAKPPRMVSLPCWIAQYVCLLVTYVCVIGVIVALYTITPEIAMEGVEETEVAAAPGPAAAPAAAPAASPM